MAGKNTLTQSGYREKDIKALLISHLIRKKKISSKTTLINEFSIDNYANRADIVTVHGKNLDVYEIKSEADTLQRLQNQVNKYQQFFNKVTVVCDPKHSRYILDIVPNTVAVWEMKNLVFKVLQRGRSRTIPQSSMLKMMTKQEISKLSFTFNIQFYGQTKEQLETDLQQIPSSEIINFAVRSIENKYASSSKRFWKSINKAGEIDYGHLEKLSPFLPEKRRMEQLKKNQARFWKKWRKEAQKLPDDPLMLKLSSKNRYKLFGRIPATIKQSLDFQSSV